MMKPKKSANKKRSATPAQKKPSSGIREALAENAAKHKGVSDWGLRKPGTRAL